MARPIDNTTRLIELARRLRSDDWHVLQAARYEFITLSVEDRRKVLNIRARLDMAGRGFNEHGNH